MKLLADHKFRGDMLEITVHNGLQDNGTAMHWHGVRQLNSVGGDGVPGMSTISILTEFMLTLLKA